MFVCLSQSWLSRCEKFWLGEWRTAVLPGEFSNNDVLQSATAELNKTLDCDIDPGVVEVRCFCVYSKIRLRFVITKGLLFLNTTLMYGTNKSIALEG